MFIITFRVDGGDEHIEFSGIAHTAGGLGHDDEGEVEDGVVLGAIFGAMIPWAALLQLVQLDVDAEAELVIFVEEQFVRFGNERSGLVVAGQVLADEEVGPGGVRVAILGALARFIREIKVAAFAPFFAGIEEEVHGSVFDQTLLGLIGSAPLEAAGLRDQRSRRVLGEVKLLADLPEGPLGIGDAYCGPAGEAFSALGGLQVIGVALCDALRESGITQEFGAIRLVSLAEAVLQQDQEQGGKHHSVVKSKWTEMQICHGPQNN